MLSASMIVAWRFAAMAALISARVSVVFPDPPLRAMAAITRIASFGMILTNRVILLHINTNDLRPLGGEVKQGAHRKARGACSCFPDDKRRVTENGTPSASSGWHVPFPSRHFPLRSGQVAGGGAHIAKNGAQCAADGAQIAGNGVQRPRGVMHSPDSVKPPLNGGFLQ